MCGFVPRVMSPTRTPFRDLAQIAEVAARAPHFVTALETTVREIGRVLTTHAYAIEEVEHNWSVAATTSQAPPLSPALLEQVEMPDSYTLATLRDPAGAEWAAIPLGLPSGPRLGLLLQ